MSSKSAKPVKPAKPAQIVFVRGGKMAIINAPPNYQDMARVVSVPKDSTDPVDTIHLFVADVPELQRLLPAALAHQGARTNLVVMFRHHNQMRTSRDAISGAMQGHGYRPRSLISMGDSDWGAVHYGRKPAL